MSQHRCLAGAACRQAVTTNGDRHGAPTENPDTLCPPCDKNITSAIHQLPRDWADLRAALGERAANTGQKIRSTPTPGIPISTGKEALMAAIVDMADRAAAVISNALNTDQPTGRRKPPQKAETGSIAWRSNEHRRPEAAQALAAAIAITEPNIVLLAAAPAEDALIWTKPDRCDTHQHLIGSAEAWAASETRPAEKQTARDAVRRAYAAAGTCDECNGWGKHGQERELTTMTGLQILLDLEDLHHKTRHELGKTRLRRRYPMPCPRCGGRVGRDDGETIITCDNRDNCKSSWTEREYQFLAGLITRERLDMEITKWLLAEAYARLDDAQARLSRLTPEDLALPGGGIIIAEAMRQAIGGHKTPDQRAITTDRKTTQERQTTEDNWTFPNESPYRPPKPRKKATRPPGAPTIAPSSLSTLVDTDEQAALNGQLKCTQCNLMHAGDCA